MKTTTHQPTDFIYLLRFVAAMLVVLRHYSPFRNTLVDNGGEAVSFSFLLSGFILVIAYEKQIFSNTLKIKAFYIKRLARIYPLYVLALGLVLVYHFSVENIFSNISKKLPLESIMLQSWVYPGSLNYPAWSISCEIFFYLTFPFYIIWLKNQPLRRAFWLTGLTLISSLSISYILNDLNLSFLRPDLKEGYLVQHPIFRFPVFLLGNVLGLYYLKNIKIPPSVLALIFGIGCGFLYLNSFYVVETGMAFEQLGLVLCYVCLIFSFLQSPNTATGFLSHRFFLRLGDISYGIYLLQYPVYLFVARFLPQSTPSVFFAVYVLILLVFSYFTYIFIEKPLRSKITNALMSKPQQQLQAAT